MIECKRCKKQLGTNAHWCSECAHAGARAGGSLVAPPMDLGTANLHQVGGEHYKKLKIQHWDYVLANNIPYLEAQAVKYITRHRDKNGRQDLLKAMHFIEKMLEAYYGPEGQEGASGEVEA